MHRVAISSTGLYLPPEIITNAALVAAFNCFADESNATHVADIAAGRTAPVPQSSVEFIEKA
jgi:beta-ketodecanoyl-[acyl-carrier-protein] synthase